jgi:hypothetical protein
MDGILTCGSTPRCLILVRLRENWIASGQHGENAIARIIISPEAVVQFQVKRNHFVDGIEP